MYHDGHFFGQPALQCAASRILSVFLYESVNHVFFERGEDFYVALGIVVAHIEPELIESIGCGAVAVEPHIAALCLAKFLAVGLGYERTGQCICLGLGAQCAADEFGAGGHVAPLVVATQLQLAVLLAV